MRSNLLMAELWYQELSMNEVADALRLPVDRLFAKLIGEEELNLEEIRCLKNLLGLTHEETDRIFFS